MTEEQAIKNSQEITELANKIFKDLNIVVVRNKYSNNYQKKYRENNKDKIREIHKRYCERHKELINERHKIYYAKNKEKIKEYKKSYYHKKIKVE